MEEQTMNCPMIQIMIVENGYIITASHNRGGDGMEMFEIVSKAGDGQNPMEIFQKFLSQQKIKESTRRKPIEHHIAKNKEELFSLVSELLSTMKG